jgi:D-alanyl-lipoteichoic acid acyltransferase DltB (MBOAT superfamily)
MDFSALTDIAIGVGLLFGIESPENFDHPFTAANITEFWRRWHMSLTSWLRDYVFTPLRMLLRAYGNYGLVLSLTINMMLIAVWHGFNSSFLVFGLLHSFYLIVDTLSWPYRKRYYKTHALAAKAVAVVGPVFTYHLVATANVFFRAHSFTEGMILLGGLAAGFNQFSTSLTLALLPPNHHTWVVFPFAVLAFFGDSLHKRLPVFMAQTEIRWLRWSSRSVAIVLSVFVIMILLAGHKESSPFLYENF